MDHSKYILLTTDLHLPVLKNTLRCLEVFERLGYGQEKYKLILNRYNSKYQKFDLTKAEEILKYPIAYTIANDYVMVSRSLNTGIPVAELDENCILAKQFEGLARLLLKDFKVEQRESGNPFRGFFGRRSKDDKAVRETRRQNEKSEGETVAGNTNKAGRSNAA
jgi:pilus assembly protein CpaE